MATTRQIEIFVKTARLGSLRLAAESLGISQPSVSKQIRALEKYTGSALFVREPGRSLRLSKVGREVLTKAEQSLRMRQSIQDSMRNLATVVDINFYVRGFLSSRIEKHFHELVAAGMDEDTTFVLVDDQDDIYQRVHQDRNGISLLRSLNLKSSAKLQTRILRTEKASLFASAQVADNLESGELRNSDLLFFMDQIRAETTGFGMDLLHAAGLDDIPTARSPQFIERKLQRILAGDGIGIFLDWHVRKHLESGELKRLSTGHEDIHFMLMANPLFDRELFESLAEVFEKVLLD